MSSSNFLADPHTKLIADASVIINLNATLRAADIISALPCPFFVTENACLELQGGMRNGHQDYAQLTQLIEAGVISRIAIDKASAPVYETLIDGPALGTLDDGEAATIAHAHSIGGSVLIDERKARTLCRTAFPGLFVASTVDVLIHYRVEAALGKAGQADAIANALMTARMRVPPEHMDHVISIIGAGRARLCSSLPRSSRNTELAPISAPKAETAGGNN